MPKPGLNRDQLAKLFPNHEALRAFELLFGFSASTPATIEEVAALAGTAAAVANQALAMLAEYAAQLEQLCAAPAPAALPEPDDFTPTIAPPTIGTLGEQDADNVKITGGSIDGTTIGETEPDTGAFTTLAASGALTLGKTGAGGRVELRRASNGDIVATDTMVGNDREFDNTAGDTIIRRAGVRRLTAHGTGVSIGGELTTSGGAVFHITSTSLTDGVGAAAGTLSNAPVAGNPTKWIAIKDNGIIRYIPTW